MTTFKTSDTTPDQKSKTIAPMPFLARVCSNSNLVRKIPSHNRFNNAGHSLTKRSKLDTTVPFG